MYIYSTAQLNDAIEKFRNEITGYNTSETWENAEEVLENSIISNIDEEINRGFLNHADETEILVPATNNLDITNTIDVGDIDGYFEYFIGHKDMTYMPDDQFDSLDDAYVTYIALVIMQKVTLHNMNTPH